MIEKLMNSSVKNIKPYPVGEDIDCSIILDKNENPYNIVKLLKNEISLETDNLMLNRYPEGSYKLLREELSRYTGINAENIVIGNGSDELLYMIMQAFLEKGEKVLLHTPTFAMYKSYANMVGGVIEEYETDDRFCIELETFKKVIDEKNPKILIICNPNNPTGSFIEIEAIEYLIQDFTGIVIIDEAYMEFCNQTAVKFLEKYKNVIILRTFSKALGLAGLRIGYMLSSMEVIDCVERAKSPYNVNAYSPAVAVAVLKNIDKVRKAINIILEERNSLISKLAELKGIEVFESKTNFVLIRADKCKELYASLFENGIAVKGFNDPKLKNCIRLALGTSTENRKVLETIEAVCKGG